ncbi:MAG: hypothetical protein IPN29_09875 [Saprospiraceae bacterium]|nr:hypothetical protein [Saprospiraceae bacterium]
MKRFEIAIIDDQGLDTGFGRFLALLYKNQYLSSNDFALVQKKDYTDGLGKNMIQNSIAFQIYTHNYGNQGFKKCFCEAFSDFDSRKDQFDIYIFDLNFIEQDNNSFYPLHSKNQCDTSKKFKKGLTLDKVNDSDKSTLIAGLEFYHCLKPSFKPKIIYSAAQETAVLRSSVKLFNSRLYDTFIVDVTAPAEVRNDSNDPFENMGDVSRTFDAIDIYFQSRQIAIINSQLLDKVQLLSKIVKEWNGKVENADEPLIPDNGTDSNPANCWSLRTLFPKQVNRIELGIDVEENTTKILETIGNLNFPSIYKFLVHDHGNLNGMEYENVKNEPIVINRFPAILDLEFNTTEKVTYEKFSEIVPNQSAYSHKTIRRKIYDINFDVQNQTVYKESNGTLEEKKPLELLLD